MKLTAIYLQPQNGYKTQLRSDTLWGMLCWAIRNVYGKQKLEDFIAAYEPNNENVDTYALSSCFPYIQTGETKTHFFPIPKLPPKHRKLEAKTFEDCVTEMNGRKDEKKRIYLTQTDFEAVLKTGELPQPKPPQKDGGQPLKQPKIEAFPITRNTIDRIRGGTFQAEGGGQLFHVDEYHIQSKNEQENIKHGLFFLAKGNIDLLRGALNYLQHTGLGGDRTVGKGWFKIHIEDFILNEPKTANACTTLSLYHPNEAEINDIETGDDRVLNYKLEMRAGRLGFLNYKQVMKNAIMMFEEGSVFPVENFDPNKQYGQNPIVLKKNTQHNPGLQHDVSHYGIGFMVKMNIPNPTNH